MLSILRYCGYLIILILCFYSTSFSQPLPACDDCGTTGTLEGPYHTTFSVDPSLSGGCNVTIAYYKRTCKNFTNMFITQYTVSGTTCSNFSGTTLIDRALAGFLSNTPPFPPFETTDPPCYWRVMKPTCWKKKSAVGAYSIDTLEGCPTAPCCITYFGARNNNCGQIVTHIPFFYQSPSTCPLDSTCTVSSCNHDPFDSWK